MTTETEYIVPI